MKGKCRHWNRRQKLETHPLDPWLTGSFSDKVLRPELIVAVCDQFRLKFSKLNRRQVNDLEHHLFYSLDSTEIPK
jgi:hypothetical protein